MRATGCGAGGYEMKGLMVCRSGTLTYLAWVPDVARCGAAVGKHPINASLKRDVVAAWTMVAQAVLNSDACVWKR